MFPVVSYSCFINYSKVCFVTSRGLVIVLDSEFLRWFLCRAICVVQILVCLIVVFHACVNLEHTNNLLRIHGVLIGLPGWAPSSPAGASSSPRLRVAATTFKVSACTHGLLLAHSYCAGLGGVTHLFDARAVCPLPARAVGRWDFGKVDGAIEEIVHELVHRPPVGGWCHRRHVVS